jgi:hypothetical protein
VKYPNINQLDADGHEAFGSFAIAHPEMLDPMFGLRWNRGSLEAFWMVAYSVGSRALLSKLESQLRSLESYEKALQAISVWCEKNAPHDPPHDMARQALIANNNE